MINHPVTYLALGDSYTIGEGVPSSDNFPSQLAAKLRSAGLELSEVTIVAKTGWTTGDLAVAVDQAQITRQYDLVTLLIGVNDQYGGLSLIAYEKEFTGLLARAIAFAGNDNSRVYVLSIPDWSATPYAETFDRSNVSAAISEFNQVNERIAASAKVNYCNITIDAPADVTALAEDQLHPSAKEYSRWVQLLSQLILQDNQHP